MLQTTLSVMTGLPSRGAYLDAVIKAFQTAPDFHFVESDVRFRFSELVESPVENKSTHIWIDGLVPIEEGSTILTSSYYGINISDGTFYDFGQVILTLPTGSPSPCPDDSSPITGLVERVTLKGEKSGWAAYGDGRVGAYTNRRIGRHGGYRYDR